MQGQIKKQFPFTITQQDVSENNKRVLLVKRSFARHYVKAFSMTDYQRSVFLVRSLPWTTAWTPPPVESCIYC